MLWVRLRQESTERWGWEIWLRNLDQVQCARRRGARGAGRQYCLAGAWRVSAAPLHDGRFAALPLATQRDSERE